jgi:hypothetical protein
MQTKVYQYISVISFTETNILRFYVKMDYIERVQCFQTFFEVILNKCWILCKFRVIMLTELHAKLYAILVDDDIIVQLCFYCWADFQFSCDQKDQILCNTITKYRYKILLLITIAFNGNLPIKYESSVNIRETSIKRLKYLMRWTCLIDEENFDNERESMVTNFEIDMLIVCWVAHNLNC